MSLRKHYADSANHAAYLFMHYIEQLEQNNLIANALDNASPDVTDGRTLSEIVWDDIMERFTSIMAAADNDEVIPVGFYENAYKQRYNDNLDRIPEHHIQSQMYAEIEKHRFYNDAPKTLPTFLKILEPYLEPNSFAGLTHEFNNIFEQVWILTGSDETLSVHNRHANIQDAAEMVAQNSINLRSNGGNSGGVNINQAPQNAQRSIPLKMPSNATALDTPQDEDELVTVAKKLASVEMPDNARITVNQILRNTLKMNPQAVEHHNNMKRLQLLAKLPWDTYTETAKDLNEVQRILDEDHYGMQDVKNRIIEFVAAQMRTDKTEGNIICLAGPPGVGKTSIARSAAKALGRNYVRMSLGGVHNETVIRGLPHHYASSQQGRVLQSMVEAKSNNPLIVLDEIDKLGQHSANGDPTSAMLEVLDPEQNHTFRDSYADVEYDLSKVFFFATANDLSNIPGPLLERMEVISLPGYMPEEKFHIAKRYLMPKQMAKNGLSKDEFSMDDAAIRTLISDYTREAGVRGLEKEIKKICRKAAAVFEKGRIDPIHVTTANLREFADDSMSPRETIATEDQIGVVNGLAYTPVGGDILPIEVNRMPSQGGFKIKATGRLGQVMGESVQVAESLVRSMAPQIGIKDELINKVELHVHAPDGAVPKDGPSAGAAFTTVLVSSLTGIPVRRDIAMTGEITNRGRVTAIGGLREKLQGALDAGVATVLIPKENLRDLKKVPETVKNSLEIIGVETIEEVLDLALTESLRPLPKATADNSWTTRLRRAWEVMKQKPSNDNDPYALRQRAGIPHKKDDYIP